MGQAHEHHEKKPLVKERVHLIKYGGKSVFSHREQVATRIEERSSW
jgi:hypothetical protein